MNLIIGLGLTSPTSLTLTEAFLSGRSVVGGVAQITKCLNYRLNQIRRRKVSWTFVYTWARQNCTITSPNATCTDSGKSSALIACNKEIGHDILLLVLCRCCPHRLYSRICYALSVVVAVVVVPPSLPLITRSVR